MAKAEPTSDPAALVPLKRGALTRGLGSVPAVQSRV